LSKIIGSNNKLNNAIATIRALNACKHADYFTAFDKNAKPEVSEEETVDVKETKKTSAKKTVEEEKTEKKAPAKKPAAKKPAAKKTTKKEEK
jgi:hypothetical protein